MRGSADLRMRHSLSEPRAAPRSPHLHTPRPVTPGTPAHTGPEQRSGPPLPARPPAQPHLRCLGTCWFFRRPSRRWTPGCAARSRPGRSIPSRRCRFPRTPRTERPQAPWAPPSPPARPRPRQPPPEPSRAPRFHLGARSRPSRSR